jgi:hypothetical protein
VVAEFTNDQNQHGVLLFTAVNSDGQIPRTPGHSPYSRALAPLHPLILDDFAETSGSGQTMMLQYWLVQQNPLGDEDKQRLVDAMHKIRSHVSTRVAGEMERAFEP